MIRKINPELLKSLKSDLDALKAVHPVFDIFDCFDEEKCNDFKAKEYLIEEAEALSKLNTYAEVLNNNIAQHIATSIQSLLT